MDLIKTIEEQQKKENAECFRVGDTVKVHFEIIEGKTKRIQVLFSASRAKALAEHSQFARKAMV